MLIIGMLIILGFTGTFTYLGLKQEQKETMRQLKENSQLKKELLDKF